MSSEFEWYNIVHFLIVCLIIGATVGIIIDNGLSHVLLPDGGKLIKYSPLSGLFLLITIFSFLSFMIRLSFQIRQGKNQSQQIAKPQESQIYFHIFTTIFFYLSLGFSFSLLLFSRFISVPLLKNIQFWLVGLNIAGIILVARIRSKPSFLVRCNAHLQTFLVVSSNRTLLYTYGFTDSQSQGLTQPNTLDIATVLSTIQSFIRFALGSEGQFKYLQTEQGVVSVEKEMGLYFCLVTDKMNRLVSETARAMMKKLIGRFGTDLLLVLESQSTNPDFSSTFDNDIVPFGQFFL